MTPAIVYAVLTILLAWWTPGRDNTLSTLCQLLAIVTGAASLFYGWDWFSNRLNRNYRERREADAITPQSEVCDAMGKLADKVRGLNDEQLRLVGAESILGIDNAFDGEQYVRGTSIPMWFAHEFLTLSSDTHLVARSRFGSMDAAKYKLADELTNAFIRYGYAQDARDGKQWTGGNQPATWTRSGLKQHFLNIWFEEAPPMKSNGRDAGHSPTASAPMEYVN